jgi:mannose-6-phosphate isomerase-like protein (cupin superfamily)
LASAWVSPVAGVVVSAAVAIPRRYWEIAADAEQLREHHHPTEEVCNVVEGELAMTVDGVEHVLAPSF